MKKLAKLKFWSFLISGLLFLFFGAYFYFSGSSSSSTAEVLMMAGIGQLVLFYGLLFYLYKGNLKSAMNN
ncbi:hypothetical protein [Winogradskyella sp. PC D3.3]